MQPLKYDPRFESALAVPALCTKDCTTSVSFLSHLHPDLWRCDPRKGSSSKLVPSKNGRPGMLHSGSWTWYSTVNTTAVIGWCWTQRHQPMKAAGTRTCTVFIRACTRYRRRQGACWGTTFFRVALSKPCNAAWSYWHGVWTSYLTIYESYPLECLTKLNIIGDAVLFFMVVITVNYN